MTTYIKCDDHIIRYARGGSFWSTAEEGAVYKQDFYSNTGKGKDIGFRLFINIKDDPQKRD